MNEKTRKIIRIIHIIVAVVVTCAVLWRLFTGEFVPHLVFLLLLVLAPFKFYNTHVVTKKQFEDSGRGDEYKKIVVRSAILAPIIVAVFITIAVLIMLNT